MKSAAAGAYSLQKPEWLVFLLTLCAVAEGAAEVATGCPAAAAACVVLAVLKDPQRRVAAMGGREGLPRSIGSVLGGSIARFLGGFRGGLSHSIAMTSVKFGYHSVAVSRDGSTLLVSDWSAYVVHVYSVHTGAYLRAVGGDGDGPPFRFPSQVWVASDGFVFVADAGHRRVQVLSPRYDFHSFVGAGQLNWPHGVCANDGVIVVSEFYDHRLTVFNRNDGALVHRFGMFGENNGQLTHPACLCFMSSHRHVAVVDSSNSRVSVWTLEGEFVRHVRAGKANDILGIACSDADELIVADRLNGCFVVNARGEVVWESGAAPITGVAVYGSTIFGQIMGGEGRCFVFT